MTREPIFFRRLELGRPILIPAEGFPFVHLVHVQDVASLMVSLIGNERAHQQIYNVAGSEITSVLGCIELMARAVGVRPDVVHVPLDIARHARHALVHWGEATVGGAMFSVDKAVTRSRLVAELRPRSRIRRLVRMVRSRGPRHVRVRLLRRRRVACSAHWLSFECSGDTSTGCLFSSEPIIASCTTPRLGRPGTMPSCS